MRRIIGVVFSIYIGMTILLNIPYIQQRTAALAAGELSTLLHTSVSVGKVDMGLLNRIIIDDMHMSDQSGKEMIRVKRLAAKFNILPLLKGKISISNVQLFGFNINLEKKSPEADANFKFVLDALSSKDDKGSSSIDLRINSLLIRRGRVAYNVLSEPDTPGQFNASHINLQNIIANISLKALQTDSINASIKRFSVDEENSGFELKKLTMKLTANTRRVDIDNFAIGLRNSLIGMETISMSYDSLADFNNFEEKVHFRIKSAPTQITLADVSPFVPALKNFKEQLNLDIDADGTMNQLNCNRFAISSNGNVNIVADGTMMNLSDPNEAFIYGNLSKLNITKQGMDMLVRNITGSNETPATLRHLGNISFFGELSGYFTDIVAYGSLHTDIGNLKTDIKISSDSKNGLFAYSGTMETEGLDLGTLTDNEKLGTIVFNMNVDGKHSENRYPEIVMDGLISNFDYNGYNYENITLDGEYKNGGFNGQISVDDPNGSVTMNGEINMAEKVPSFNFVASVDSLYPNRLKLTDKYEDAMFSINVRADFTGSSIDDMNGTIDVNNLQFSSPEKSYEMRNLHVEALHDNDGNSLSIRSPFMTADFAGRFKYSTISTTVTNILSKYLPTFVGGNDKKGSDNDLRFDIYINNTDILSEMLDVPIHIYMPSTLKGYLNERNGIIGLEGYFPRLRYGEKLIESAMITGRNDKEKMTCNLRFTNRGSDDAVNVSALTTIANDKVDAAINWGNIATTTYSGKLSAVANFVRHDVKSDESAKSTAKQVLRTTIDINPSDIILSDTLWQVHKSQVVIDGDNIDVNRFLFNNDTRHLLVNGRVSKDPNDTLTVDLKDINLSYVFDIADVTDDVKFSGDATGRVYAANLHGEAPLLNTHLDIRNFCLNDALLGNLDIYGAWNNENKGIFLDAKIANNKGGLSKVKGHIFPIKPNSGLDLNIEADRLNIKFIERYMESIVQDLSGDVTGNVHFYGRFKELTLNGSAMANAGMRFDILGTSFHVNDSIRLHPEGIDFTGVKISDINRKGTGAVNGYLRYNHFKDIRYMLNIEMNNMLVMNTKETIDLPFYGTVYATGNAILQGNATDGLNATVAVSTNKNTTFVYNTGAALQATDTQFITFIDRTPKTGNNIDEINASLNEEHTHAGIDEESDTDIRLNLLIDATPDAQMKIVMDPAAGDYISGKGSGNIKAEFYNKGDFKMFGTYNIQQGVYKFSLQEVIRKDFNIKDGSSIAFNGDPIDANLDIQASYTVPSASLNDLIPDASTIVQQTNVKVNCIMNLTGVLQQPTIKLSIDLPNERDEVQTLVRNYISTDEQMNMQMLYLLGIGKFYTENNNAEHQSDMMSSVLSSTLSGQLNNLLSQIIDNNNWNIGTNFSTGEKGWTDMEVEGILSGQMLNNRLLVNGNFGYRDNPMANTNFVGDFDAQWLLNRSGDIRLKAYNETNDRYYTKTNLTTQGVGIMFKKDFDKWSDLFFWNRWRMKRLANAIKQEEDKEEDNANEHKQ